MRYIGNKTRLVPFLLNTVQELGLSPGVACDPFAGTASVGKALKAEDWQVHSGDLMAMSYALQVAHVVLDAAPPGTAGALDYLGALPGRSGFVTEHFTPDGSAGRAHGRMYFTPENANRIDRIREQIGEWEEDGSLTAEGVQYLLACLIQAADRVANTTGVYASFVKSWQPNALKPLTLVPLSPTPSGGRRGTCTAFKGGAETLVGAAGPVDLLYLDPPYNQRQYPGYYHIPEILARGWWPPPELRGKTGLMPDQELRSDWCRPGQCAAALRNLLDAADAKHVLLSYNDEGLLSVGEIEDILTSYGRADSYRRFRHEYRRYRSDSDRPGRQYRRNAVAELVHYVRG
ncbi:MAG: DNA adenine methylase [Gemmatimonadota bacterium]